MTDTNTDFCKTMFASAKYELCQRFGTETADRLLRENMDVCGNGGSYFLHWVADGIIIEKELYKEKQCGNIYEARADAIWFLLGKLFPEVQPALDSDQADAAAQMISKG